MNWLTSKRSGSGSAFAFDGCAVCVVISGESSGAERVKLVLSNGLIAAYRLQSGDKLQAGFSDDGRLMLRRHSDGNTITGRGFTKRRSTTKSKGSSTCQPYVAFEAVTYPGVRDWAKHFENRTWIEVVDHGTHWESVR
jgi:hypothetical protein